MRKITFTIIFVLISLIMTACNSSSVFGPTFTATPTITPTFTSTFTPTLTPIPTITPRPTLTPIPTVDYSQAFFDPQSEADFPRVIEAPSPIDDPADFAVWQDGYLAAVNEKLATYTGPSIDGQVGVGGESFAVDSKNWPVIASYKFTWNGQEMLTKTLVFKDKQGNLIPVSITYTTPTSGILFDAAGGYKTPPPDMVRSFYFRCVWDDSLKKEFSDKFEESFLPAVDTDFNAQYRTFGGIGTAADRDILSRSRFIWSRFSRN